MALESTMKRLVVALLLVFASASCLSAQAPEMPVKPELRLDGIYSDSATTIQLGGGVQIPAGYYVRIGLDLAAGADFDSRTLASGRADLIARFLFDPFRQQRWGLSAGGGVSLRMREADHARPCLVAVLDLEGPRSGSGVSPAIQVGFGGGVRAGLVLRWSAARAR